MHCVAADLVLILTLLGLLHYWLGIINNILAKYFFVVVVEFAVFIRDLKAIALSSRSWCSKLVKLTAIRLRLSGNHRIYILAKLFYFFSLFFKIFMLEP